MDVQVDGEKLGLEVKGGDREGEIGEGEELKLPPLLPLDVEEGEIVPTPYEGVPGEEGDTSRGVGVPPPPREADKAGDDVGGLGVEVGSPGVEV